MSTHKSAEHNAGKAESSDPANAAAISRQTSEMQEQLSSNLSLSRASTATQTSTNSVDKWRNASHAGVDSVTDAATPPLPSSAQGHTSSASSASPRRRVQRTLLSFLKRKSMSIFTKRSSGPRKASSADPAMSEGGSVSASASFASSAPLKRAKTMDQTRDEAKTMFPGSSTEPHPRLKAMLSQPPPEHTQKRPVFRGIDPSFRNHDLQVYRSNYKRSFSDNTRMNSNIRFYENRLRCQPDNLLIEDIFRKWKGKYDLLEAKHGYIQWLFPIPEHGMNYQADPLQRHELVLMKNSRTIINRAIESYKLMLDFYGLELENKETGHVRRSANWRERYHNLEHHPHNFLRITRILKFLGLIGQQHYQVQLVLHFVEEMIFQDNLRHAAGSLANYWIGTILHDPDRLALQELIIKYSDIGSRTPGKVSREASLFSAASSERTERTSDDSTSQSEPDDA